MICLSFAVSNLNLFEAEGVKFTDVEATVKVTITIQKHEGKLEN